MRFDVEIYFSGLCFFSFDGREPKYAPKKCQVLLVNATGRHPDHGVLGPRAPEEHQPRMVIPAKNFIVGGQDVRNMKHVGMSVSAEGEDLVVIDLTNAKVRLSASKTEGRSLYVPRNRQQGNYKRPTEPGGRFDWFDWVALLHEIEPRLGGIKKPTKVGSTTPYISWIEFTEGELETHQVGRQRGEDLLFDFKTVLGSLPEKGSSCPPRCISDRLVLRFRRLARPLRVTVAWNEEPIRTFGIGASRPEVQGRRRVVASIANLDTDYHPSRRAIYDFLWYYEMFNWVGKPVDVFDRLIPWPQLAKHSGRTPSSGNCPPGSK